MNAYSSKKFVGVERFRAEYFGELAATDAPVHFKLPEPITRVHEADRKRQVTLGFCFDQRDAVCIERDRRFAEFRSEGESCTVCRYATPRVNCHGTADNE